MPLLPPETIQVRIRGTKRNAPSDDRDNPDEEYLRIQDEFSGNAIRYVYKRIKRTRTAGTQHTVSRDNTLPATSHTTSVLPSQLGDDHTTSDQPSRIDAISSPFPKDEHASQTTTSLRADSSNGDIRYHITQPAPLGTQLSFIKPRTKTKPRVLFETRKAEQPKERDWTVPTNTTRAPTLDQQSSKTRIAPLRNVRQASGQVLAHDASAAELDEAMKAYTLDSIGIALASSTPSTPVKKYAPPLINHGSAQKYKPKAPTKRYHERHPSDESAKSARPVQQDTDRDMMDLDDESFVDDFVRVPIEEVKMDSLRTIGVLVIDAQEDAEAFYGGDSDDEDEIYDEEEDENAENHHSTEYPDEEVDSDDEFDRNPYSYRRGNASDDEEFDEDEATFSDEEDVVGTTKSWSRKPPWMRSEREKEEAELEEWN